MAVLRLPSPASPAGSEPRRGRKSERLFSLVDARLADIATAASDIINWKGSAIIGFSHFGPLPSLPSRGLPSLNATSAFGTEMPRYMLGNLELPSSNRDSPTNKSPSLVGNARGCPSNFPRMYHFKGRLSKGRHCKQERGLQLTSSKISSAQFFVSIRPR